MIHAYDKDYLDDAMQNLGEAFDYAVNVCGKEIDEFMQLFIVSGFSEQFEKGTPKIISGTSGTELVIEIISKTGLSQESPEPQIEYDYSPEYWCGWILAYYQWYSGRTFKNIMEYITMKEVRKLYPTLYEAAEEKFVDTLNAIIKRKSSSTRLQTQRKKCGYSQRELAEKSGVNIRTLQQYEMRAKDINKAAVTTLIGLAKALSCKVEDLLEYEFVDIEQ